MEISGDEKRKQNEAILRNRMYYREIIDFDDMRDIVRA